MLLQFFNSSSTLRGFQLLCVLVVTFGPSSQFEPYVRSFLQTSQSEGDVALRTIALRESDPDPISKSRDTYRFYLVGTTDCKRKLDVIHRRGPRTRAPMYSEIEHAFVSTCLVLVSRFAFSLFLILKHRLRCS